MSYAGGKQRCRRGASLEERLLHYRKIDELTGCWNWQASFHSQGYGQLMVGGSKQLVHRLSYTCFVGELDAELEIDHVCENKRCFNPQHLEQVTSGENTRRAMDHVWEEIRNNPFCPNAHKYTEANTILRGKGRVCRECTHQSNRRARLRCA